MSTALNNNSTRRRPDGSRMPKSKAIKGIDEDMKLNKALWEMAEYFETAEHNRKIHPTGERIKPSPELGLSGVTESNPELGITFRYSRRSHIWCKRFHFLDCDRDFGPWVCLEVLHKQFFHLATAFYLHPVLIDVIDILGVKACQSLCISAIIRFLVLAELILGCLVF